MNALAIRVSPSNKVIQTTAAGGSKTDLCWVSLHPSAWLHNPCNAFVQSMPTMAGHACMPSGGCHLHCAASQPVAGPTRHSGACRRKIDTQKQRDFIFHAAAFRSGALIIRPLPYVHCLLRWLAWWDYMLAQHVQKQSLHPVIQNAAADTPIQVSSSSVECGWQQKHAWKQPQQDGSKLQPHHQLLLWESNGGMSACSLLHVAIQANPACTPPYGCKVVRRDCDTKLFALSSHKHSRVIKRSCTYACCLQQYQQHSSQQCCRGHDAAARLFSGHTLGMAAVSRASPRRLHKISFMVLYIPESIDSAEAHTQRYTACTAAVKVCLNQKGENLQYGHVVLTFDTELSNSASCAQSSGS